MAGGLPGLLRRDPRELHLDGEARGGRPFPGEAFFQMIAFDKIHLLPFVAFEAFK